MSEPADDRDARAVVDLREFATVAAAIVATGKDAFFAESADGQILRYAARTVLLNVSAAADRFSDAFRAAHPHVPWRAVRDTRNRIAHDYAGVNDRIIWAALARDVPSLVSEVAGEGANE